MKLLVLPALIVGSLLGAGNWTAEAQTLENVAAFSPALRPFGLARGPDNRLYGVTQTGGATDGGTFFRLEDNGAVTTLASFTRDTGTIPVGLTLGRDGNFYGAARGAASTNRGGAIFKVTLAGAVTHLASLGLGIGFDPRPNLVEGEDGVFYGTSGGLNFAQGPGDAGSVFKVDVNTRQISPLKLFSFATSAQLDEGIKPADGLARGTNGSFYGTCELGGLNRKGVIFQITPGGAYTKLVDLGGANGSEPLGTLVAAADGMLYGTAQQGVGSLGTAFRLTTAGVFNRLTNFFAPTFGSPRGTLVSAADGSLIGYGQVGNGSISVFRLTTAGGLSLLASIPTQIIHAQGFAEPSLVMGGDGAAFGTASSAGLGGASSVFRVPLSGGWTNAATFVSETGFGAGGALTLAADGSLYGLTRRGGRANLGTVYQLSPAGALQRVADFTAADGREPIGQLVPAPGGVFYGVTAQGGTNDAGTAFRASTDGTLTTLSSLGGSAGQYPNSLLFGPDGALYGATSWGPTIDDGGRVFRLTTAGVLGDFANLAPLGLGPPLGLLLGSDGVFYGGANTGVYRVTTNGTASVVARLPSGLSRLSPLVQGADGHLYSTTYSGGKNAEGTVVRITREGQVSILLDLAEIEGRNPLHGLTRGADGLLYSVLDHDQDSEDSPVILRVTPGGFATVLYNFNRGSIPLEPQTGLTFGSGGGLYGVARDSIYRLTGLPSLPPYAQTGVAESLTETGARLNGEVVAGGGPVAVSFDYGLTTNYGRVISAHPSTASGFDPVDVHVDLAGLTPRTTYHYRLRAGGIVGPGRSFRTGPAPTTLEEALDAPGLPWTTDGVRPWFLQTAVTFDGEAAAQSGEVDDDERSELRTTVAGPGTLSFRWKVSSEEDYDELFFFVNGSSGAESISGETEWREVRLALTNGVHQLLWCYSKDDSDSDGADAAWVDAVTWTPEGQITITEFARLTGPNPRYGLTWRATAGQRYAIETSVNLGGWTAVPGAPRTATTALETLDLDLGSNAPASAFFRVRQLP